MSAGNITDVAGIKVGNRQDEDALTGCTAIVMEEGATCGVDVRGSAPGTRETDLLDPIKTVDVVHGICLSGGSAFGLDAASGVMSYLEEENIGLDVEVAKVPIVPAAVLFDLPLGKAHVRPDKQMGYEAAKQSEKGAFAFGNQGAGCGAAVGKLNGFEQSMKGGLGSASVELDNGLTVGAVVAVNALGEIRNPATGEVLAGAWNRETGEIMDSLDLLKAGTKNDFLSGANTTIGVVATNSALTKPQAKKVAQVSQNAFARTIYPAHTTQDGDTVFAVGTGTAAYNLDLISQLAQQTMEKAVLEAIMAAEAIPGTPSYKSVRKEQ